MVIALFCGDRCSTVFAPSQHARARTRSRAIVGLHPDCSTRSERASIAAVERAFYERGDDVAAILMEPIQCEGGFKARAISGRVYRLDPSCMRVAAHRGPSAWRRVRGCGVRVVARFAGVAPTVKPAPRSGQNTCYRFGFDSMFTLIGCAMTKRAEP
jgi:hypothetical protein